MYDTNMDRERAELVRLILQLTPEQLEEVIRDGKEEGIL